MSPARPGIRGAVETDLPFLWEMLGEALAWPDRPATLDEMLADPRMSCYLDDWGRCGDLALVAEEDDGTPLGAAWCRLYPVDRHGYGFVAEDVPEVVVGVRTQAREGGVGTALLTELAARARAEGRRALSLSSDREGRPRRLYERLGYRVHGHDPTEDLVVMVLDLDVH